MPMVVNFVEASFVNTYSFIGLLEHDRIDEEDEEEDFLVLAGLSFLKY
jgi:hypothetical protein